jgi:uncharacterized LabA/DUF88 family protein
MASSIPVGNPAASRGPKGLRHLLFWGCSMPKRVICYVDGFNLYHAIDEMTGILGTPCHHLKWLDLWKLAKQFTDPSAHRLDAVHWFSAIKKTASSDKIARHQMYCDALEAIDVTIHMAHFKQKTVRCKKCHKSFTGYEEKESDVNLAVQLVSDAYEDRFDNAFVISRDSDLTSPLRFVRNRFPQKKLKVIAPPERMHSKELWAIATHRASITKVHLEQCLLPQRLFDASGGVLATRDPSYDPPV